MSPKFRELLDNPLNRDKWYRVYSGEPGVKMVDEALGRSRRK